MNTKATQIGLPALLALILAISATASPTAVRSDRPRQPEHAQEPAEEDAKEGEASEPKVGREASKQPWLGIVAEEAPEVVSAQLGLANGEGLVVMRVEPESPAAKAGLEKNDVLAELGDQRLVHPAQLRKLVLARKPGDEVQLTYYRAGKRHRTTATIAASDATASRWELEELPHVWRDSVAGPMRDQLRTWRDSLDRSGINAEAIRDQVRRSMEEARKAIEEAMRQATNAPRRFGPARREFRNFSDSRVEIDKDASVTVESRGSKVKTIVKSDDSGSYVIVADPRKRLTAHDKEGKLLFDGEIETEEQQGKVPREVWAKVEPMLDEMK